MPAAIDPANFFPATIREHSVIAKGIHLFALARADGGKLPAFTPGAHIALMTPLQVARHYSLINPCGDDAPLEYRIAVKREEGGTGGSTSLIDQARDGDVISISEPVNDFPLVPNPAGYIFIAGGIGITPILAMVRHVKALSAPRFRLYYCTRSPEATAFLEELSSPLYHGVAVIHHDHGDPAHAFDFWPILEKPKGQHIYCCGPRGLMQAVRDMTGHWSSAAVHFEDFDGAKAAHRPEDRTFVVHLARSGKSFEVPADTTLLAALRANGVRIDSSCESGTCGTCRTRLLSGLAEHRDWVLDASEQDTNIMPCVSRAQSTELVLDL